MAAVSFRGAPVRVEVPATSANLGPGFDSLGLALDLHDVVLARVVDRGLSVDVAGEGAADVPRDEKHLVVRAMRATFTRLGGQPPGLEVVCANRIPHGRGLGSSAAAIVAGVVAAGSLVLGSLSDDDALALATKLEGHPDNVAACLLGGATLAWSDGERPRAVRLGLHPDITTVVFVPTGTLQPTRAARRLLPASVPHALAARTAARAGLLVHALATHPELLASAAGDELHEPFRLAVQPDSAGLVHRLRTAGVAAVLSGSGPTVLALCPGPGAVAAALAAAGELPGWQVHQLAVDRSGARAGSARPG